MFQEIVSINSDERQPLLKDKEKYNFWQNIIYYGLRYPLIFPACFQALENLEEKMVLRQKPPIYLSDDYDITAAQISDNFFSSGKLIISR